MKRKTTAQFIQEAIAVHGKKYDYSLVDYRNTDKKVKIICPEHGVFEQTPHSHIDGRGCEECGGTKKLNTSKFIEKAIALHGDKYDYSQVEYKLSHLKVKIICPIHGVFGQSPNTHLSGHGCGKCKKTTKLSVSEFIEKAKAIHGDFYDYSQVEYTLSHLKVKIICPIHGVFGQVAGVHLSGSGCKSCAKLERIGSRKITTFEKFKQEASVRHQGKYDYSLANYVNYKTPIKIICNQHGVFTTTPQNHMRAGGCRECMKAHHKTKQSKRITRNIINSAKDRHGDKYDYSLLSWNGRDKKVKIICPEHGVFEQLPNNHLRGSGCPQCGKVTSIKKMSKPQECFVDSATKKHSGLYDYSLVEYKNNYTPVKIICSKHGVFEQKPFVHLYGSGCTLCSYESFREKKTHTFKMFEEEARQIHGDKYDYSLASYVNKGKHIKIICPDHGEFYQIPQSHLAGVGCRQCAIKITAERRTKSTETFIREAREKHGDTYDYSLFVYSGCFVRSEIVCSTHGSFFQSPNNHLRGQGCPSCGVGSGGFDKTEPGNLYLLKFEKPFATFWKVGITNKTVQKRFGSDFNFITYQRTWSFSLGINAYNLEQSVLSRFHEYRFSNEFLFNLLNKGGDTECFVPSLPHQKVIAFIESEIAQLITALSAS